MKPSDPSPTIVLIGASVRALAFSAVRAGWKPVGFDLFADRDLQECAEAHRIRRADYPEALERLASRLAGRPWMYTGGLENYPDVIDRLAQAGPLWGNPGSVLRQVRDPLRLYDSLVPAGLHAPPVARAPDGIPTDGSWLQKPLAGAGGLGIRPWTGGTAAEGAYYQRRVDGAAHSAVYLAAPAAAALLGVTRQLVGDPEFAAPPFRYCGSVGPVPCAPALNAQLEQLGNVLARTFGLLGLFGVDFVLANATAWIIEVNPRYPASTEALELACGWNAVALQRDAVAGMPLPTLGAHAEPVTIMAKGILYAPQWCRLRATAPCYTAAASALRETAGARHTKYADIPEPNTCFAPGDPMLTILEAASSPEGGYAALRAAAAAMRRDALDSAIADNRAGTLLRNAYRLRCPVCKEGKIFRGWLTIVELCPSCRVRLDRQGGDFLGSIYFNYAATGIPVIAGYLLGRLAFELPDRWLLSGLLAFAVVFPLYYLRYARSLWLALDQFFDPRQPPAIDETGTEL